MLLEDVADGRVRDVIADVGEGALDSVKSPRWVFLGKAKNQIDDHLADPWPADVLSFVARVPFLGDEQTMPSQDRIRGEQRADFLETFATEDLALDRESTPLVVTEEKTAIRHRSNTCFHGLSEYLQKPRRKSLWRRGLLNRGDWI